MTDSSRAFPGKEVRISPAQQLESGFLFFRTGNQYRHAAMECGSRFRDPLVAFNAAEEWGILHDPVCNLIGHSAELYLKAFLLAKGKTPKDLAKRDLGHNLMKLYEASKQEGLVLDSDSVDALASLSPEYGEAPYIFRYPELGKRKLNFLEGLFRLLDALRDAAFPTVNERARSLGTPVE
ncbi:hypothetical protein [Rhizobium sp.]|uniref:hypothetical protein n=1 Tax=Rhizobium sp. TaxID=391 RepID=UPI0028A6E043